MEESQLTYAQIALALKKAKEGTVGVGAAVPAFTPK